MPLSSIVSSILGLILFVGILVLAYFVTIYIGKKNPGISSGGGNIKVVDRAHLGQDRDIFLVKIAGEVLLLGVTQHHIEKLADIDPSKLPDEPESPPDSPDFRNILQTLIKNKGFSSNTPGEKKGKSDDGEQ